METLKSFRLILFLAAFCWGNSAAETTDAQAENFLIALEASWTGRAELTPIGPRDYDIRFARDENGRVAGSTGNTTIHYWTFYRQGNELMIRFLSTFAGNRDPIFLTAEQWDATGVLFRAKNPELLSVRVSHPSDRLSIDVFHWNQPHVSIRLSQEIPTN